MVGLTVGFFDGIRLGMCEGRSEGPFVGLLDGALLGFREGRFDGPFVGDLIGTALGFRVGTAVGFLVGFLVGCLAGFTEERDDGFFEKEFGEVVGREETASLSVLGTCPDANKSLAVNRLDGEKRLRFGHT
jgi:hypothetical protein